MYVMKIPIIKNMIAVCVLHCIATITANYTVYDNN